jgi:hypothetical protein
MSAPVYLTKSRYAAGLQCLRRLWLDVRERPQWEEPESGSAEDIGFEIGRMARLLFPGGVEVEEKPWEHAGAVARTVSLMADRSVPAIFEAAFEHSGIRVRVDVLERLPHGYWGMREVKSSGEVKEHFFDDVAVQLHVLGKAGVRLSSAEIMHVNKSYVRGERGISWPKFFSRVEVKIEARKRLVGIEASIRKQLACLSRAQAPEVEPDGHCHYPYSCEYWDRCTAFKPADWIFYLPNLRAGRREELEALGVESISGIPDDFPLSPRQKVVRHVTRSGKLFVAPELSDLLKGYGPPAFYLDFEAFLPAVPLYVGTKPYQVIPFQWSLHRVDSDASIDHREFLADAASDPRRPFAETLISALKGSKLPIIVYSPYEKARLNELAAAFPNLGSPIGAIVRRLRDLLPAVRSGLYHPDFGFSSSIKTAARALCPDITYDDLGEISDGGAASTTFWRIATGGVEPETAGRLRRSLLAYCRRDTWAMVRLHQALNGLTISASKVDPCHF